MEAEIRKKEIAYKSVSKSGKEFVSKYKVTYCSNCENSIHKIHYNIRGKILVQYPKYCYWCGSKLTNCETFGRRSLYD